MYAGFDGLVIGASIGVDLILSVGLLNAPTPDVFGVVIPAALSALSKSLAICFSFASLSALF